MTSPVGYNNPAYIHQFDSSLYDYQYVPDIDPEYDGHGEHEQEQIHLVHPNFREEFSGTSEEFDASDESNQSIIVEECNNRRVTLICEKRRNPEEKVYEDRTCRGAYHHDISLESEEDFTTSRQENMVAERVSLRHQRKLEPPAETVTYDPRSNRNVLVPQCDTMQYQTCRQPQRQHRYEEIEDFNSQPVSRHRYAEITVDENGFPSIGNEIEVEHSGTGYRVVSHDNQKPKSISKPRAPSPANQSLSPTFSPSKTYQRTVSPKPPLEIPRIVPSIEMAEFSPPRKSRGKPNQIAYLQSPKRQPPVGASSPAELQEQIRTRQGKTNSRRQGSVSKVRNVTPSKPSVTEIFQVTPKSKTQERNSSRRNISYSFTDPPRDDKCNPYRPTTTEVQKAKTAVITPILSRKNEQGRFQKTSQMFQSTGNLHKAEVSAEEYHSPGGEGKSRMKRNRSVPNFAQSLANDSKYHQYQPQKSVRKLEYQYSPAKSVDRFSPIDRSRLSLIDQTKTSWSNSGSDFHVQTSGCLILGAVIQIVTSVASCAICFYLFSKVGRRYYIDFGILAGFVNFVLGVLGFRSQCWRWLPNRNYVSGYILLTTFSIITCAGFVYLITARPMSGEPILDLLGGGICGVSVLTIILSVTGLTMSGCCKTPPPDNRVNNI